MIMCLLGYLLFFSTYAFAGQQDLVGGRIAEPGELPFSVFIGNCTASIVGPEVVMTAGHCRASGDQVKFNFEGKQRQGNCTRHPQFNNNTVNNDFALCKFSPRINDTSAFAEIFSGDVNIGDDVTLQGFGQNRLGTLQVGNAEIVEINNQDLRTNSSVRLGGGDSGGGLLLGNVDTRRGPFKIIGVNSRVGGNLSFFNRTNLARSQEFFKDFAKDEKVDLCGVNKNCNANNRNDCESEQEIVDFFKGELADAERLLDQCLERK